MDGKDNEHDETEDRLEKFYKGKAGISVVFFLAFMYLVRGSSCSRI